MVETMTAGEAEKGDGAIEVEGWASRITRDLIVIAGLGRDFGAISNQNSNLVRTYNVP